MTTVSDDFVRPDGDLGSDWTVYINRQADTWGLNKIQVVNHGYSSSVGNGGDSLAVWNADAFSDAQWAKAAIQSIQSVASRALADSYAGVALRASLDGNNTYWFFAGRNTFQANLDSRVYTWEIWKYNGNIAHAITPVGPPSIFTSIPDSPGDVFLFWCFGNQLFVAKNGVPILNVVDADLVSGSPGLWCWSVNLPQNATDTSWEDWSIADTPFMDGVQGDNHTQWTDWQAGDTDFQFPFAASASDLFNRANGPVGGNWAAQVHGFNILSNACVGASAGENTMFYSAKTFNNDQSSGLKIIDASTAQVGPMVRCQAGIESGYYLGCDTGAGSAVIYRVDGGAFTPLAVPFPSGVANGDVMDLRMVGSTLTAFQNGVASSTTASDSTYLGGWPGARIFGTTSSFDNWTGTSLSLSAISGNAGAGGATVAWSGTSSGSVTADGSGNYTIPSLINGSYTIRPSLSGQTFSPTSRNQVVSGSDITGVDFTATPIPPAGGGGSDFRFRF